MEKTRSYADAPISSTALYGEPLPLIQTPSQNQPGIKVTFIETVTVKAVDIQGDDNSGRITKFNVLYTTENNDEFVAITSADNADKVCNQIAHNIT